MIDIPLPYADTATTPDEAAMAFAAAGVIAARGGLFTGDVELLDTAARTPHSVNFSWILPWRDGPPLDWNTDAATLAREWRACCDKWEPPFAKRLMVTPHNQHWQRAELIHAIEAAKALARLALSNRDPYQDWRDLPSGQLGAVSIIGEGRAERLHWNWPPRTLVTLPGNTLDPAEARYGYETVHLANQRAGYDIALLGQPAEAWRDNGYGGGNFNVVMTPVPLQPDLIDAIETPALHRPLAFAPFDAEAAAWFHRVFIDEISHDAPYDIAFFTACLKTGTTDPHSPLIVAPRRGYGDQMDRSSLTERILELQRDLPEIARYGGITTVTLPFPAPEFDLEAGPVELSELADKMAQALDRGIRFDSEERTGHDMWALDIATRDFRFGVGSAEEESDARPSADAGVDSLPDVRERLILPTYPGRPDDDAFYDAQPEDEGFDPDDRADEAAPAEAAPEEEESAPSGSPDSDEGAEPPSAPQSPAPNRSRPQGLGFPPDQVDLDDYFSWPPAAPASSAPPSSPAPQEEESLEDQIRRRTGFIKRDRIPEPERPRYTSLAIHPGLIFEGMPATAPLADTEPLKPRQDYSLSLALKADRTGIKAGNAPKPAQVARKDRETIKVYAVASCDWQGGPDFVDPLQVFDWKFDSDTDPVFFHFQMPDQAPFLPPPITIRLYSAQLHLLDLVQIVHEQEGPKITRKLYWDDPGSLSPVPEEPGIDALSFHVARRPGGYHVEAIFSRGGDVTLELDPHHLLATADLEILLAAAREFWTENALSTFASKMSVGNYTYKRDVLPPMVDLGRRAWRCLFGSGAAGAAGTSERLGQWIAALDLSEGTVIRVTTDDDAADFVFPWQLLLPPGSDDASDFWGLRYIIEITRKYGRPLYPRAARNAQVGIVLDNDFRDHVNHPATLDGVFQSNPDVTRLNLSTAEDVITALTANPAALYYFFCHGSTGRQALTLPNDLKRKLEAEIGDASDWRRDFLKLVASGSAEARIKTDIFTLAENQMRNLLNGFDRPRPIVFLNMCHSADLLPGQSDGLTRLFLDLNSAAVLGTECPMNAHFADAFAAEVLGRLLAGASLGQALREARRHFHDTNNLLGFAYVLYGHADATLFQPEIPTQEPSHEY